MPIVSPSVSRVSATEASVAQHRPRLRSPKLDLPANRLGSIVDLSPEGKESAARSNIRTPKVTNAPRLANGRLEHLPLKDLIDRYNFNRISVRDLTALAKDLHLRREISADAKDGLLKLAATLAVPGHPEELFDFVAHVNDRTDKTLSRLPTDPYSKPESYIPHYRHAKHALDDLMSFIESGRDKISTTMHTRWPARAN